MPGWMPRESALGVQPTILASSRSSGSVERIGGRAAGDGDGLAELGGRVEVVDAAADDAGGRLDRAVLAAGPALAHADGVPPANCISRLVDTGKLGRSSVTSQSRDRIATRRHKGRQRREET